MYVIVYTRVCACVFITTFACAVTEGNKRKVEVLDLDAEDVV